MIKVVIFDLDDTLVSEYSYIKSGFKVVASQISKDFGHKTKKIYSVMLREFKKNKKYVFNRTLEKLNISYNQETIQNYLQVFRTHSPKIKLFKDVISTLKELRESGFKLGIITDGYKETQKNKIEALELELYIDKIVITDELGSKYWKPHPMSYELMRNYFDVEYEEMIYIGDNIDKDFVSPINLGIHWILIQRKKGIYKSPTTKHLKTLKRLKRIINKKRG